MFKKVMKLKKDWNINRLKIILMILSGIVKRIIFVLWKELNCKIKSSRMIKLDSGNFVIMVFIVLVFCLDFLFKL